MEKLRMLEIRDLEKSAPYPRRISIGDHYYSNSILLEYDYSFNSALEMAIAYFEKIGLKIDFQAKAFNGLESIYLFTRDFNTKI